MLAALLPAVAALASCHSYHVDTTVQNHTGGPIKQLEVDYPSASFGINSLEAGAIFHYRIQIRSDGQLKVQYTDGSGHQPQIDGPTLMERQEGSLEIELLPGGKAEFHPRLNPQY